MLPSAKKTTTASYGSPFVISPSSIPTSILLFTLYFFDDIFVEFVNNLSTIGYTIFFSSRIFLRLTIPPHAAIKKTNNIKETMTAPSITSRLSPQIKPNTVTLNTNHKVTIARNPQLCKNLYFTYRITTSPDEDFSSTEYGCLFRLNICLAVFFRTYKYSPVIRKQYMHKTYYLLINHMIIFISQMYVISPTLANISAIK